MQRRVYLSTHRNVCAGNASQYSSLAHVSRPFHRKPFRHTDNCRFSDRVQRSNTNTFVKSTSDGEVDHTTKLFVVGLVRQ